MSSLFDVHTIRTHFLGNQGVIMKNIFIRCFKNYFLLHQKLFVIITSLVIVSFGKLIKMFQVTRFGEIIQGLKTYILETKKL